MTPAEIKAAMLLKGISQTEIAEALDKGHARINEVINGRSSNKVVRAAIAKAIGKPIEKVFPDEKFRRPSGRIVRRAGFRA